MAKKCAYCGRKEEFNRGGGWSDYSLQLEPDKNVSIYKCPDCGCYYCQDHKGGFAFFDGCQDCSKKHCREYEQEEARKEQAWMQREDERRQEEKRRLEEEKRRREEEERRREALKPDWQKRIDADISQQNFKTCHVCGQTNDKSYGFVNCSRCGRDVHSNGSCSYFGICKNCA